MLPLKPVGVESQEETISCAEELSILALPLTRLLWVSQLTMFSSLLP